MIEQLLNETQVANDVEVFLGGRLKTACHLKREGIRGIPEIVLDALPVLRAVQKSDQELDERCLAFDVTAAGQRVGVVVKEARHVLITLPEKDLA
jgi:hypothetical protein